MAMAVASASRQVPHYHGAYYDDAFIADPFQHYAEMRALGPVIYLPALGNFAITRYREVREALRHFEAFSSAMGVSADQPGCDFMRGAHGNTLNSDPPDHDIMRTAVAAPLLPGALEAIRGRIEQAAERLVDALLAKGDFDGMADLARHLPVSIVTELVGLAEHGRENMLQWAAASFDILGIQNERGRRGMETAMEMRAYILREGIPETLKAGSWTARLHELADAGQITREMCPLLFRDYIAPSLDTTISATGQLFHLLGRHPEIWQRIRRDASLIPGAVNEAVRLGSPIRSFSRTLIRDYELAGVTLPAGARVMCLYASANRDERHFPEPDRFDPGRPGTHHLGFGHGIHQCVGMHLARLEMESLLRAMAPRVESFVVGTPVVGMNNTIYGFESMSMSMRLVAGEGIVVAQPSSRPAAVSPQPAWRAMRIADRVQQAEGIASFDLISADGAPLPAFTAGAHVDVQIAPGLVRQYSLCNDPADSTRRYRIAVLRDAASRGGSKVVHEAWQSGHAVLVSAPRNTFPLDETAQAAPRRTILVAGGVGITPMLAMAYRLQALGRDFTLHYCVRTVARAAFLPEIEQAGLARYVRLHVSTGSPDQRFLAVAGLGPPRPDTDVYCCGPVGLMDGLASAAAALGWPVTSLHLERFGAATRGDDTSFTLVAQRSGLTLEVAAGTTILDVLAAAGIEAPSSCCAGVCATCLTDVICGVPDHRDLVLTAHEKTANRRIAICCSRSLSRTLVLDI